MRFAAATNRNLAEEVREGRFRADLYHRLAVARLRLPPLAERPEDIPVLASHFAAEHGVTLTPELVSLLTAHDWPGNVRELKNSVARLALTDHPFHPDEAVTDPRRPAWRPAAGDFPSLADARRGAQGRLRARLLARHGLRGRDRG